MRLTRSKASTTVPRTSLNQNQTNTMTSIINKCTRARHFAMACLFTIIASPANAQTYSYTAPVTCSKADSALVVELLQKGRTAYPEAVQKKGKTANGQQKTGSARKDPLTIFYAKQFIDLPYVAHTLEVNKSEQLVVNLHELDCTTYVETVLALTLATQHGGTTFQDYCYWLSRLRYRDGIMNEYPSRNHYFSQWIRSNERQGLVKEIRGKASNGFHPFTATQKVDLHYMTVHPDSYAMLRTGPMEWRSIITQYENEVNDTVVRYIPNALLNKGRDVIGCIHDGDVLSLVTSKDGLDVSHLGFALWGKDGKLHLLNASSANKRVLLDPLTLYQYMLKKPTRLGIRAIRLK